ncbi:L-alanine exporter AlaE [archaeon]|jgi:hypothetical protein|nr:L-alanine exporter AlaE [archaeon]MBT3577218.1 L-alanine exporter AlaE [archaeon]MBT6820227.1 L-alanine exporter AlaE [archaeon]MBT6956742.1 L-alanine exporter AlaE [archaeon]MBT7025431.1 L-alanine exporter AlaE [archaeon]
MVNELEDKVEEIPKSGSWLARHFDWKAYAVDTGAALAVFQPLGLANEVMGEMMSAGDIIDSRWKNAVGGLFISRLLTKTRDYFTKKVTTSKAKNAAMYRSLVDLGMGLVMGPSIYLGVLLTNPNNTGMEAGITTFTGTCLMSTVGSVAFGKVLEKTRKKFGTEPDWMKNSEGYDPIKDMKSGKYIDPNF